MNWVERRAQRDRILDSNVIELWHAVRAAIQDACDSFNNHYSADPDQPEVVCRLKMAIESGSSGRTETGVEKRRLGPP
jgi:hypothetical protein